MEIVVFDLTEENLRAAPRWGSHPYSCKYCLYWEHPELLLDPEKEGLFRRKQAWVRRVRAEFGECGRLLYAAGNAVAYAQFAPPEFLPNAQSYSAGPASADAVFLACLFIPSKEHRGHGLGSLLLHNILRDLRGRGIKAVETFARKESPENPSGPLEFYLKHGFRVLRDHAEFPLLRLEL
ncbi:MAG: GNAT family N-acetyltransferase [Candidatus Bipolaricaulota bacterium]|nr:GNAT family N-acetyltransferase [Candidatus Bipolaricaulota bacterium]MDW8126993.1 GNAT family N-acetyltransferase [Candidatus Bipolaricaulota bacterium]